MYSSNKFLLNSFSLFAFDFFGHFLLIAVFFFSNLNAPSIIGLIVFQYNTKTLLAAQHQRSNRRI